MLRLKLNHVSKRVHSTSSGTNLTMSQSHTYIGPRHKWSKHFNAEHGAGCCDKHITSSWLQQKWSLYASDVLLSSIEAQLSSPWSTDCDTGRNHPVWEGFHQIDTINYLMQERCNSIANALEFHLSCINLLLCSPCGWATGHLIVVLYKCIYDRFMIGIFNIVFLSSHLKSFGV